MANNPNIERASLIGRSTSYDRAAARNLLKAIKRKVETETVLIELGRTPEPPLASKLKVKMGG